MHKVNIFTVSDVKFLPFKWWSNWADICIFNFGNSAYLLQMSVSRNNAKKFRSVALGTGAAITFASSELHLTQMAARENGEGE